MILATHEPQTTSAPSAQVPTEISELELEAKIERNHQQFGHYFAKALFYWNRIITILLTAYSIRGVWNAFYFVLVTNPQLNENLASGLVTTGEVNNLSAMAITVVITTIISAVLAIRLHRVSRESVPTLDLVLSMTFLVLSSAIENRISMIDFVSLIGILS